MQNRGFKHNSNLDSKLATGKELQDEYVNTVEEQIRILKNKGCLCKI